MNNNRLLVFPYLSVDVRCHTQNNLGKQLLLLLFDKNMIKQTFATDKFSITNIVQVAYLVYFRANIVSCHH